MFEQFRARAEGVSAEVHRFATRDEALAWVAAFLDREGLADAPQQRAVWAECPMVDAAGRQRLSAMVGVSFAVSREAAAGARFGISQMDWALADTGTLVQDATAIDKRLVSTLPTIHIALLPTGGILADMPAWLEAVRPQELGYIAMITGPSRTADIERVLTIGVHGPERLVIVAVDEPGGTN